MIIYFLFIIFTGEVSRPRNVNCKKESEDLKWKRKIIQTVHELVYVRAYL